LIIIIYLFIFWRRNIIHFIKKKPTMSAWTTERKGGGTFSIHITKSKIHKTRRAKL